MKRSRVQDNTKILFGIVIFVIFLMGFASIPHAMTTSYEIPSNIDPSARYLFFLHNYYVEQHGPNGACRYYDILKTFADEGFTVISEVRSGIDRMMKTTEKQ